MGLMYKWQRAWLLVTGKSRADAGKLPEFVAKEKGQGGFFPGAGDGGAGDGV